VNNDCRETLEAGDSLLFHFSGRSSEMPPTHALGERGNRDRDGKSSSGKSGSGGGGGRSRGSGRGHSNGNGSGGGGGGGDHGGDDCESALCPEDVDTAGPITRGELRRALLGTLSAGVRLTVILDCPGRGGAGSMDLPYTFRLRSTNAAPVMAENGGAEMPRLMAAAASVAEGLDFILGGGGGGGDSSSGGGGRFGGGKKGTASGGTGRGNAADLGDVRLEVQSDSDSRKKPGLGGANSKPPAKGCCLVM
jgi:hypothetical protein